MKGKILGLALISLLSSTSFANPRAQGQLLSHHEWMTGHATLLKTLDSNNPVSKIASRRFTHPVGTENIFAQIYLFVDNEGTVGEPNDLYMAPHVSIYNDDDVAHNYTVSSDICVYYSSEDLPIDCAHSENKFLIDKNAEIADFNQGLGMRKTFDKANVYAVSGMVMVTQDDRDVRFTTMTDTGIWIKDAVNPEAK